MTDFNGKVNSTSGETPLGTNPNGDPARYQTTWSCASVIGIMMYLASNYWRISNLPSISGIALRTITFFASAITLRTLIKGG